MLLPGPCQRLSRLLVFLRDQLKPHNISTSVLRKEVITAFEELQELLFSLTLIDHHHLESD
jgi:hypothetical protein